MKTEHEKEVEMQERFVEGTKNFFGIIFAGILWILGMAFFNRRGDLLYLFLRMFFRVLRVGSDVHTYSMTYTYK